MHALYKGDTADAVLLSKNVARNDTLGAKRYIYRVSWTHEVHYILADESV